MILQMKAGKYTVPVNMVSEKGRLYFQFPFNKNLMAEIKALKNPRYHGYDEVNPRKIWSLQDCAHNRFQIAYLAGKNPYEKYDASLIEAKPKRDILRSHQIDMFRHIITRMQCLVSGEMGVGKTLSAIEAMEYTGYKLFVWVGTSSSIAAVKLEFKKWECKLEPLFLTYHTFRNMVKKCEMFIPDGIIFDESQKLKTHNSQVTQCAIKLTEAMVGGSSNHEPLILEMSGAPAPNNPADWWSQCTVACPGYLREGDWHKFRNRLAIMEEQTSLSNQTFQKVVTWKDDTNKCELCGKFNTEHEPFTGTHDFRASKNEVQYLYERMKGLNIVFFKKDCLDLPELQYRTIELEASDLTKRAAELIIKTVPRTVTALMKLRELSDGFQYKEKETGKSIGCPRCYNSGKAKEYTEVEGEWEEYITTCNVCNGTGHVPELSRQAVEIPTPKEQLLVDLLEEHEDIGRFVIYAGFQASVDRCVRVAKENDWNVIRADGRGWEYSGGLGANKESMLETFQDTKTYQHKTVFIGQAGAAGTGLTLTASPSIFFYSNSFNADDRIQAIARIHRIGMDINRGATIIDCLHLDIDRKIIEALDKKLDLLALTMGQLVQ
jgi:SNF2 family DNA or RNA helicase